MASGSFEFPKSSESGSYLQGQIVWESKADTYANTSSVTATIKVRKGNHDIVLTQPTVGNWTYIINIDGNEYQGSVRQSVLLDYVPLGSFTVNNIAHNANGTKQIAITGSVTGPAGSSFAGVTTIDDYEVVNLDNIPRASTFTVPANATIGTTINVPIVKAFDGATHTLSYDINGNTGTIASGIIGTSYRWVIPLTLCNYITTAMSGTCTLTLTTYMGDVEYGTHSQELTLNVPNTANLIFGDGLVTLEVDNTGTAAENIDACVQGYSKVTATFDPTEVNTSESYGATAASYEIHIQNIVTEVPEGSTSVSTGVLTTAGTMAVQAVIRDSRGRQYAIPMEDLTVEAYAMPTLSGISVIRCDSTGKADESGTYILLSATASCSSINGENSIALKATYMPVGKETGAEVTLTSGEDKVIGEGQISPEQSYSVTITAVDSLGNIATYTAVIPTAAVAFHLRVGGQGGAFGKYCEHDQSLEIPADWCFRIGDTEIGEQELKNILNFGNLTDADNISY